MESKETNLSRRSGGLLRSEDDADAYIQTIGTAFAAATDFIISLRKFSIPSLPRCAADGTLMAADYSVLALFDKKVGANLRCFEELFALPRVAASTLQELLVELPRHPIGKTKGESAWSGLQQLSTYLALARVRVGWLTSHDAFLLCRLDPNSESEVDAPPYRLTVFPPVSVSGLFRPFEVWVELAHFAQRMAADTTLADLPSDAVARAAMPTFNLPSDSADSGASGAESSSSCAPSQDKCGAVPASLQFTLSMATCELMDGCRHEVWRVPARDGAVYFCKVYEKRSAAALELANHRRLLRMGCRVVAPWSMLLHWAARDCWLYVTPCMGERVASDDGIDAVLGTLRDLGAELTDCRQPNFVTDGTGVFLVDLEHVEFERGDDCKSHA